MAALAGLARLNQLALDGFKEDAAALQICAAETQAVLNESSLANYPGAQELKAEITRSEQLVTAAVTSTNLNAESPFLSLMGGQMSGMASDMAELQKLVAAIATHEHKQKKPRTFYGALKAKLHRSRDLEQRGTYEMELKRLSRSMKVKNSMYADLWDSCESATQMSAGTEGAVSAG